MLNLKWDTPKEWLDIVLADFDAFLLNHASCERKVSAVNMSFVVKYPDRVKILDPLIKMSIEELDHFHRVYKIIEKRGLTLLPDEKNEYVNALLKHARPLRDDLFLDRLLICGIIEARACERLGMVAEALEDPDLKRFYMELTKCEARHHSQFVHLGEHYFPKEEVKQRLEELLVIEAEVVQKIPFRAAIH